MKTPKLRIPVIATLCALCLGASPVMAQSNDIDAAEAKLSEANYVFALDLLNQVATEEPGRNIFISPFSVSTAMQMVAEGAAGTTRSEIEYALKIGAVPANWTDFNFAEEELNRSLNANTSDEVNLANGVWYQNQFQINPDFAGLIRDTFHAELAPVNFSDPATATLVNQWAKKQTQGRIHDLMSAPFPIDTAVVLANAIYFKGKWYSQFDKALTKSRDFYLPDGTVKQTPMMSKHTGFEYQETDDYQAVQLQYDSRGMQMQMVIFLPKKDRNPQQLLALFSKQGWTAKHPWIFSALEREGTFVLPKFKITNDILLNDTLERLGIRQAFDPHTADFSAMGTGPERLYISEVKQKSFVAVDEEGTEAAAATMVRATLGKEHENPAKPFEMIVNRPFLFVITAWGPHTQMILFMGIVNDPVGAF